MVDHALAYEVAHMHWLPWRLMPWPRLVLPRSRRGKRRCIARLCLPIPAFLSGGVMDSDCAEGTRLACDSFVPSCTSVHGWAKRTSPFFLCVRARMQTAAGHRRYITLRNCRPDSPSIPQRLQRVPRLAPAVAWLLCGPWQFMARWPAWSLW